MQVTLFLGTNEETAIAEIWNDEQLWGDVRETADGELVVQVYPAPNDLPLTCDWSDLRAALDEAAVRLIGKAH